MLTTALTRILLTLGLLCPICSTPIECNKDLTSIYIKNPSVLNGETPDESILQECPQLTSSCCSKDEFKDLITQTHDRGDEMDIFKSVFISVVDLISELDESQFQHFVTTVSSYDCLPTDGATLNISQTHIQLSKQHLIGYMNKTVDHFRRLSSSFVCSLCDAKNGDFFVESLEPRELRLLVHTDYCKDLLNEKNFMEYLKFFQSLRYLNTFYRSVGCLNNEKWHIKNLLEYDKYMMLSDYIPVCDKGDNYLYELNCPWICKNFPIFNQNTFSSLMEHIIPFRNFIKEMFPKKIEVLTVDNGSSGEIERSSTRLVKKTGDRILDTLKLNDFENKHSKDSESDLADLHSGARRVLNREELSEYFQSSSNLGTEDLIVPFTYYLDSVDKTIKDISAYKWVLSNQDGWNLAANVISKYDTESQALVSLLPLFLFLISFF